MLKFQNIVIRIAWKLVSTLSMMIEVSGKSSILAQKIKFHQKTKNKQSWWLAKVKFQPKANMQFSVYTKSLNLGLIHSWLVL